MILYLQKPLLVPGVYPLAPNYTRFEDIVSLPTHVTNTSLSFCREEKTTNDRGVAWVRQKKNAAPLIATLPTDVRFRVKETWVCR